MSADAGCAVDTVWSGLELVRRLPARGAPPARRGQGRV
jgi:hypothetical protein